MKPCHNPAIKLGSLGLGTPKVSFRPSIRVQRASSHNVSSSQLVSHALRIRTPTQARVKLTPSHQPPLRFVVRHNSPMPAANFSPGSEGPETEAALAGLLSAGGGRWTLTADGQGVERNFKFKTFTKTWDFMTAVSLQCKIKNHHPEWSNVYNTTFIRWTTHNPKGLSTKDLELARICDALAKDFGEVAVVDSPSATRTDKAAAAASSPSRDEQQQQQGPEKPAGLMVDPLSNLANEAVLAAGGDCGCGPGPATTSSLKPKPQA